MSLELPEFRDGRDEEWIPAEVSPELPGEGAAGDQVVGRLSGTVANLTCVRVQDILLL